MADKRLDQVRGERDWIRWRYVMPGWYGQKCVTQAISDLEKAGFRNHYYTARKMNKKLETKRWDSVFFIWGDPDREDEARKIIMAIRPDKKEPEELI